MTLLFALWHDEAGFIVSAELLLIATILVLSMVVGLSEVSTSLNNELFDVATAFGSMNQSWTMGPGNRGRGHAYGHDKGHGNNGRGNGHGSGRGHGYGQNGHDGASVVSARPQSTAPRAESR